eukprot:3911907-Prymnesium_polylepis.1
MVLTENDTPPPHRLAKQTLRLIELSWGSRAEAGACVQAGGWQRVSEEVHTRAVWGRRACEHGGAPGSREIH